MTLHRLGAGAIATFFTMTAWGDFSGIWAPERWTFEPGPGGSGSLTASLMFIEGGNKGIKGETYYHISMPIATQVEFDWQTNSHDTACFDVFYYRISGAKTVLACCDPPAKGHTSLNLEAGSTLDLGVETLDGVIGAGFVEITNFVPEPGSIMFVALASLLLRR